MKLKYFKAEMSLLFLSIVAVLVLLEVAFRLFRICPQSPLLKNSSVVLSNNANLIYELNPYAYGNNSDGMHDREHDIAKPAHTIRIAIIGDSIAYGVGIEYDKRFSNVLERSLISMPREIILI